MSLQVPLAAVPAQTLSVVLDQQNCQISFRTLDGTLYFSLSVDDSPIVKNHACRDRARMLLASRYFGFRGDFVFVDTQGETQPEYTGLADRYVFLYLTEAEIDAAG